MWNEAAKTKPAAKEVKQAAKKRCIGFAPFETLGSPDCVSPCGQTMLFGSGGVNAELHCILLAGMRSQVEILPASRNRALTGDG
jgi:hypothetical protein